MKKPIGSKEVIDKENGSWEEVVDFTKIRKGGVELPDLLSRL